MNDAVAFERCTRNHVGVVVTPKHVKQDRDPFPVAEARRIIAAAVEIDQGVSSTVDTLGRPVLASRWAAAFLTGAR